MNIIDILIILLLIFTVIRGYQIGLVRQAGSLVGLAFGVVLGIGLVSLIGGGPLVVLMVLVLSVIACVAAGEYASSLIKQRLRWDALNRADHLAGSIVGLLSCLLLLWFGSALLGGLPNSSLQREIRDSRIIAGLDERLPPITDTATFLNQLFARIDVPSLGQASPNTNLNPDSVALPSLESFNAVSTAADDALVRVDGRSCQGLATGSGFAVRGDVIVTNAHVVAGMIRPYVKTAEGQRISASVIGFDPDLDIAVLRLTRPVATTLLMQDGLVESGTEAITKGFPGGGELTTLPAVVLERFTALGSSIYGTGSTARDVYALKATVREGNSGGPLIGREGQVIGVIFARSTTNDSVGYALTMPAVIDTVQAAEQQPSAGQSARCP